MPGNTNQAVIKECAAAPNGRYLDWFDTVTQVIIWARNINLLEVPADLVDKHEEEQLDRERMQFDHEPRSLYGNARVRPPSGAARSLYGRSSKVKKHWEEAH